MINDSSVVRSDELKKKERFHKIYMYSFYDKEGCIYDTPFFCMEDLFAIRHFTMVINNNNSVISNFKENFEMYRIGSFDMANGELKKTKSPILVKRGSEIIKKENYNENSNEPRILKSSAN